MFLSELTSFLDKITEENKGGFRYNRTTTGQIF
jgi:hypothetical protein